MNRREFFNNVRSGQDQIVKTLHLVSLTEAEQPLLAGDRSVKDLVAHLTYWQSLINRQIQAVLRGLNPEAGPKNQQEVDDRNHQAVLENRSRPYEEVLHDFELSCVNLSNTLELLSPEDLFEQNRFQEIDNEPLWKSIEDETYGHFEEHAQDLNRWRNQAG